MQQNRPFPQNENKQHGTSYSSSKLAQHAAWVYNNILKQKNSPLHGIQHSTRAAIYASVFANLYRLYSDIQINDEELNLLQIALLFHDSGRQGEEKDIWEKESAIKFYDYATQNIKLDPAIAKKFAEAIANKDAENEYFELCADKTWKVTAARPKNIYQKIIHDADCLDIIRARDAFDASYLDFYKEIASNNADAFEVMAKLIQEATSLIHKQGDGRDLQFNKVIKAKYECEQAYAVCLNSMKQKEYHIFSQLTDGLIPKDELVKLILAPKAGVYNPKLPLTEENLQAAISAGQVLARAILITDALQTITDSKDQAKPIITNSVAAEIYYTFPNGNLNRSTSLLGNGASVISPAGFGIVNYDITKLHFVSALDVDSGIGNKEQMSEKSFYMPPDLVKHELSKLLRKLKMGGSSRRHVIHDHIMKHSELLYDINRFDFVYFTTDYNYGYRNFYKRTSYAARCKLQSIFIQKEYERLKGIKLPIFEYSGTHNYVKNYKYSDSDIADMWNEVFMDVLTKLHLFPEEYLKIIFADVDEFKIFCMNLIEVEDLKKYASLDSNYSGNLKYVNNGMVEYFRNEFLRQQPNHAKGLIEVVNKTLLPFDPKSRTIQNLLNIKVTDAQSPAALLESFILLAKAQQLNADSLALAKELAKDQPFKAEPLAIAKNYVNQVKEKVLANSVDPRVHAKLIVAFYIAINEPAQAIQFVKTLLEKERYSLQLMYEFLKPLPLDKMDSKTVYVDIKNEKLVCYVKENKRAKEISLDSLDAKNAKSIKEAILGTKKIDEETTRAIFLITSKYGYTKKVNVYFEDPYFVAIFAGFIPLLTDHSFFKYIVDKIIAKPWEAVGSRKEQLMAMAEVDIAYMYSKWLKQIKIMKDTMPSLSVEQKEYIEYKQRVVLYAFQHQLKDKISYSPINDYNFFINLVTEAKSLNILSLPPIYDLFLKRLMDSSIEASEKCLCITILKNEVPKEVFTDQHQALIDKYKHCKDHFEKVTECSVTLFARAGSQAKATIENTIKFGVVAKGI